MRDGVEEQTARRFTRFEQHKICCPNHVCLISTESSYIYFFQLYNYIRVFGLVFFLCFLNPKNRCYIWFMIKYFRVIVILENSIISLLYMLFNNIWILFCWLLIWIYIIFQSFTFWKMYFRNTFVGK